MLYFLQAYDGSSYGPVDAAGLTQWAQEGRLTPASTLIEEGREIRPDRSSTWAIPAAAHSLLVSWARLGTP